MSSVTDENTAIRVIFQRMEIVRSLLKDDELLYHFSFQCEKFIDLLMCLCRPTYNPLRGYFWLKCYRYFYTYLRFLHNYQNNSKCHIISVIDYAHFFDDNPSGMPDYMQLVDTESKILSLLDKIIVSCVIHNQDITQGSLQDVETIQLVTHRSSSADQIVAGREALEADFNSYLESPTPPAFNSYLAGVFYQGAISRYDMIGTRYIYSSLVHNQNITQCPHTDAWPIVANREAFTAARFKYVRLSIISNTQLNLVSDRHLHYFAWGHNQTNATSSYFHSSAVHNHQNITQTPHWDAGTIQLVTRISSDSLTDPIVASREADFNSDIESVTTPLNSETTEANATSSHNQNVTQGSPNGTRVEEEPLFNQPRFLETFLAITSQAALTMLTIKTSGGSTSFSQNQKILFCSAVAFNVISFLSFLFAILVRGRRPGIARIVTGTGFICTAYAFIGIMGMLLKDNIMLWVTGLAGVALSPVFASAFVK